MPIKIFGSFLLLCYCFIFISKHKFNCNPVRHGEREEKHETQYTAARAQKIIGYSEQVGLQGTLLSYRRNVLMVNIKCRTNILQLFTICNSDLLAGLAIPGPKALHSYHNIHASFHLSEEHMPAIQPLILGSTDEKLKTIVLGPAFPMDQMSEPI